MKCFHLKLSTLQFQVCHRNCSGSFLPRHCRPFPHRRGAPCISVFLHFASDICCLAEGGAGREPRWSGGSCRLLFAGIHLQLYFFQLYIWLYLPVFLQLFLPMQIASHLNWKYILLTYFYLALFSESKLCLIHKLTQVLLLVLVNLYFYATSTRQIGKQLVYNRSMQHFQVFLNYKKRTLASQFFIPG